jgi:hypothetical protein
VTLARRLVLTVPAAIFASLVAVACWVNLTQPAVVDFISFWNAAGLVLQGQAEAVYAFQPSWVGRLMPLAYPPPFLFVIAPFGLAPFGIAFIAWVVATGALYVRASRAPLGAALANPPAVSNATVGQNGALVAAIMLFAAQSVRARPILGGALFGLLVIKPHLAVLVPVALAAGRHWTAFAAAAMSSLALLVLAALVFGLDAYRGAFEAMPQYAALLEGGRWRWNELASVFALMRWLGASHSVALGIHAIIAIVAAVAVWRAWREDWDSKIPVLATASLLVSPYLFAYDTVLLVAPLAWLATRRPAAAAAVWILSLVPLVASFGPYAISSTLPLAIVLALAASCAARSYGNSKPVTRSSSSPLPGSAEKTSPPAAWDRPGT